jgi:hypothetical protein
LKGFGFPVSADVELVTLKVNCSLSKTRQRAAKSFRRNAFSINLAFLKWPDTVTMDSRITFLKYLSQGVEDGTIFLHSMLFPNKRDFFSMVSPAMMSSVFGKTCFYTDAQKTVSGMMDVNLISYKMSSSFTVSFIPN